MEQRFHEGINWYVAKFPYDCGWEKRWDWLRKVHGPPGEYHDNHSWLYVSNDNDKGLVFYLKDKNHALNFILKWGI